MKLLEYNPKNKPPNIWHNLVTFLQEEVPSFQKDEEYLNKTVLLLVKKGNDLRIEGRPGRYIVTLLVAKDVFFVVTDPRTIQQVGKMVGIYRRYYETNNHITPLKLDKITVDDRTYDLEKLKKDLTLMVQQKYSLDDIKSTLELYGLDNIRISNNEIEVHIPLNNLEKDLSLNGLRISNSEVIKPELIFRILSSGVKETFIVKRISTPHFRR
jgi:hypothetical protein